MTETPRPNDWSGSGRADVSAADAAFREAIARSRLILFWEEIWPHLARLLVVGLLFVGVSWTGLWLHVPPLGRIVGLGIFTVLLLGTLVSMRTLRWPSIAAAQARLDRLSGQAHRPVTALTDRLAAASVDPLTLALWQTHQARIRSRLGGVRPGWPRSRLSLADPIAVRAAAIALVIVTFFMAGSERITRLAAAFDFRGAVAGSNVRLDAWVSPPAYTARAPILLTGVQTADAAFVVPAGSKVVLRVNAPQLDVTTSGAIVPDSDTNEATPPAGVTERRFVINGESSLAATGPQAHAPWRFSAIADQPPKIVLLKNPEPQARGSLLLAYGLEDDYGVTAARAEFVPAAPRAGAAPQASPRRLFTPPEFALVLPPGRARQGKAQTIKDLTEHPYAGADVELTLIARDEAGNEGRSDSRRLMLPQRPFADPLARSLVELRRLLALDADQRPLVAGALDALLLAPAVFTPKAGVYLGLRTVAQSLEHAGTDDELRDVVGEMWALAIAIEDGDLTDVEKDLRAAQEALRQALERGASDEEIKKLMENLRAAVQKFLQQMIEQAQRNPQDNAPLDRNAQVLSDQDLRNMLDRLDRLSRSGNRDAARQLLEQLQSMLNNLRMARPGQQNGDGRSALNELGDILRKQQRLRDRTYQQGRNPRDGQSPDGLRQDQQALRDRLNQLMDQLRQRGLMPQPGEGDQDPNGNGGQQLGEAGKSMGEAQGELGQGNSPGAAEAQGRAIEQLRRGAQGLAQALQQGQQGDGQNGEPGEGRGNREGRQAGDSPQTDPLGRPYRGRDAGDDTTVKVPGEIDVQRARRILDELRRRFSEPGRPQLELDYLERLLRDY